jgi:hypothetical protein
LLCSRYMVPLRCSYCCNGREHEFLDLRDFSRVIGKLQGPKFCTCYSGRCLGPKFCTCYSCRCLEPKFCTCYSGRCLEPKFSTCYSGRCRGPKFCTCYSGCCRGPKCLFGAGNKCDLLLIFQRSWAGCSQGFMEIAFMTPVRPKFVFNGARSG